MGVPLRMVIVVIAALFGLVKVNGYVLMLSECTSWSDCGPGECCVIGMMRYSSAQCLPLGQTQGHCREDNPPENRTLYYPNGQSVELVGVHIQVCPCEDSLRCEDGFCLPDDSYESNDLY